MEECRANFSSRSRRNWRRRAGLRAAIAAAQANPNAKIALISKVYPMRSHTVAAEGDPQPLPGSR
ncbi:FAD-binding protein [Klebsiella pneumoniae]|uniref:FAD-binding protein n=1 Tax=Klebsiella pneumoniae TaxID=573 RepID=A0A5C2LNA3_KLEPN|nr:FAD-binding protein [Klebsiella pneumoniae]